MQNSILKEMVGTVKKSMAAICEAWFLRKERHVGEGGFPLRSCNGGLSDVIAEQPEFSLNPWHAPGGILARHASDEVTDFLVDAWSTGLAPT